MNELVNLPYPRKRDPIPHFGFEFLSTRPESHLASLGDLLASLAEARSALVGHCRPLRTTEGYIMLMRTFLISREADYHLSMMVEMRDEERRAAEEYAATMEEWGEWEYGTEAPEDCIPF